MANQSIRVGHSYLIYEEAIVKNAKKERTERMELTATGLAAQAAGKVLVDIRRAEEWRSTGVITGSHQLTFFDATGHADTACWLESLAKVAGPEDDLVLICHSGHRSGIILNFLHAQTPYRQARHLAGGMIAWHEKGLPVVPFRG